MKLRRYWIPAIAGFIVGSILSLRMSDPAMRDLLASAHAGPVIEADRAARELMGPSGALEETDRFVRVFSALQEVQGLKRQSKLHGAIGDLGAAELETLLDRIQTLRGKLDSSGLDEAVLQRWFEIDRAGAEAYIRKHPNNRTHWVFLAKADPKAALKEIGRNAGIPWAEEMLGAALEELCRGNLGEKARLVLELPESLFRNGVLSTLVQRWSAGEPSEALAFAETIPDPESRLALMRNALEHLTGKDVKRGVKEISARISEIENSRAFAGLITDAAAQLARKDVNLAFEWIGSLPEKHRSAAAISGIATLWAETQPLEALQWSVANDVDPSAAPRSSGRGSVIGSAMIASPGETLKWIQAQPAGETRDAMLERALVSRGWPIMAQSEDVFRALDTLPKDAQTRAAAGMGRLLGGTMKLQDFSHWVDRFDDPVQRAATITGAAEANAFRFADPVEQFSTQFDEGADRDAALRGLVEATRNSHERTAAEMALAIRDQTTRWKALDGWIVDWLRSDPDAATNWLNHAKPIPLEWKAAWQKEANSIH